MTNEQKIKIAESCGLNCYKHKDGELEFMGTDKQWKAYEDELERQESIIEFDLQEARRYGINN